MKTKRKVIAALVLLNSITLMAPAAERDCLMVHMASGSWVAFQLSETPMITFDGGIVTIATGRYQISDVRKYTFTNFATSISDTGNNATNACGYSPDGRFFYVRLKDAGMPVKLHTTGGIEVPTDLKPDAEGTVRVDMTRLGHDIYLLTVGNETIKIRRK